MIAAWMIYCSTLGIFLAAAALLAERIVLRYGGQSRRVWAWALTGAVIAPLLGVLLRDEAPAGAGSLQTTLAPLAGATMGSMEAMAVIDGPLAFAWVAASSLVLVFLAGAMARTWWLTRTWRHATVDGVPVLVSNDVGPAVVGFLRGRIVMPAWALDADAGDRAMMLRHEQEHLTEGDQRLALFGLAVATLMPWNPALWYMTRRARLAIEVDCDRRVVRGGGVDLGAYGALLISVGRRRMVSPLGAAAFSRPRSSLERRIDRMTLTFQRVPRWQSVLLGLEVAMVLLAAWLLPQPVRARDVSTDFGSCPQAARSTAGWKSA